MRRYEMRRYEMRRYEMRRYEMRRYEMRRYEGQGAAPSCRGTEAAADQPSKGRSGAEGAWGIELARNLSLLLVTEHGGNSRAAGDMCRRQMPWH
jgi:hypothetical protein